MFKYNLGKFNLKSGGNVIITGMAPIGVTATCNKVLVIKHVKNLFTKVEHETVLKGKKVIYVYPKKETDIKVSNRISASSFVFTDGVSQADINLHAEAISALLGSEHLELKDVNLQPNEEIEINMCDLTVTRSGENAMHLLTSDGDFFDFSVGDNSLTVEGARTTEVDIYWKDKWL